MSGTYVFGPLRVKENITYKIFAYMNEKEKREVKTRYGSIVKRVRKPYIVLEVKFSRIDPVLRMCDEKLKEEYQKISVRYSKLENKNTHDLIRIKEYIRKWLDENGYKDYVFDEVFLESYDHIKGCETCPMRVCIVLRKPNTLYEDKMCFGGNTRLKEIRSLILRIVDRRKKQEKFLEAMAEIVRTCIADWLEYSLEEAWYVSS